MGVAPVMLPTVPRNRSGTDDFERRKFILLLAHTDILEIRQRVFQGFDASLGNICVIEA